MVVSKVTCVQNIFNMFHLKNFFSLQNTISVILINGLAMPIPSSHIMFWKRAFTYAYICTYLWRVHFQSIISELGSDIGSSIFGLVLIAF